MLKMYAKWRANKISFKLRKWVKFFESVTNVEIVGA